MELYITRHGETMRNAEYRVLGRTDDPYGAHYEYKPKYETLNPEMEKFVEMCFDPNSRMNERLKETLLKMLTEEENKTKADKVL